MTARKASGIYEPTPQHLEDIEAIAAMFEGDAEENDYQDEYRQSVEILNDRLHVKLPVPAQDAVVEIDLVEGATRYGQRSRRLRFTSDDPEKAVDTIVEAIVQALGAEEE